MADILPIVIYVVIGCVVGVLIAGLVSMIKGGRFNRAYSNKLMRMRIALQVLAIGLLALLIFVVKK